MNIYELMNYIEKRAKAKQEYLKKATIYDSGKVIMDYDSFLDEIITEIENNKIEDDVINHLLRS